MIRVMFVCHGNICRSPMAEMVMKELVRRRGIADRFEIASGATSTEEIWGGRGNPIYPPAQKEMKRRGIPFTQHHAVQIRRSDADYYDLLIGMDSANIRNMQRILGGAAAGKIRKLLDFTDRGGDVADPWYSGNFAKAYDDIAEGCAGLLRYLEQEGYL